MDAVTLALIKSMIKNVVASEIKPEQIQQAVNDYLDQNPVSGMTQEQIQQLNDNTKNTEKILSVLPTPSEADVGKLLMVGTDGDSYKYKAESITVINGGDSDDFF